MQYYVDTILILLLSGFLAISSCAVVAQQLAVEFQQLEDSAKEIGV